VTVRSNTHSKPYDRPTIKAPANISTSLSTVGPGRPSSSSSDHFAFIPTPSIPRSPSRRLPLTAAMAGAWIIWLSSGAGWAVFGWAGKPQWRMTSKLMLWGL
jgi:hypothetical protein